MSAETMHGRRPKVRERHFASFERFHQGERRIGPLDDLREGRLLKFG
jgi:hypothetical protein